MATIKKMCLNGDKSNLLEINQEGTVAAGFDSAVAYMAGNWDTKDYWIEMTWENQYTYLPDDKDIAEAPYIIPHSISSIDSCTNQLTIDALSNYFYPTKGVGSYDVSTLYLAPNIGMRTIESEETTNEDGNLQSVLQGTFPSVNSSIAEVGQLKIYKNMTYSQAIAVLTALYKALIQRPYIFENIQSSVEQETIADLGNPMPFVDALTSENNLVNNNYDKVIKNVLSKNTTNEIADFDTTSLHLPNDYNCSLGSQQLFASNQYTLTTDKVDAGNTENYYSSYYIANTSAGNITWPSDGDTYIEAIEYLTRIYKVVSANLSQMAKARIQH